MNSFTCHKGFLGLNILFYKFHVTKHVIFKLTVVFCSLRTTNTRTHWNCVITSSVAYKGCQFLALPNHLSQMYKYFITSKPILPFITNSILTHLPSVIS